MDSVPKPLDVEDTRSIDFDQFGPQNILGVAWDTTTDESVIKTAIVLGSMTQRGLLSMLSQVYDLIGMLAGWPFLLIVRHIVQSLFC